jgi:hypothetical protein
MIVLANECIQQCTLWKSYSGLMTDVPHILFEFSLEIVTAPIAVIAGRWLARREHRRIDEEHGVTHHAPRAPVE